MKNDLMKFVIANLASQIIKSNSLISQHSSVKSEMDSPSRFLLYIFRIRATLISVQFSLYYKNALHISA
jgi:hypothetical protein